MQFELRQWQFSDVDNLVKYVSNTNIPIYFTNRFPVPYTLEDGRKFIDMAINESPFLKYAIEINGEAVGGIDFHPQADILCKNIEIGYWIGEPFWGKGIMTEALRLFSSYLFELWPIPRLQITCMQGNIPSHAGLLPRVVF